MNVAKHVARSSLLIEHLSPTNSRVSYSSRHGGIMDVMVVGGIDGEADGGGDGDRRRRRRRRDRGGRSTVSPLQPMVLHEITHLAPDKSAGARASAAAWDVHSNLT
jgi:hypothetical protein